MTRPWQLTTGDMVDHFRVVRAIDRGGMAEVYLARDTVLGRKVALKVIQPGVFQSDEAADRFLLEAQTTARFNHPNIVTIHTVGQHRSQPYLALEFLEGETLRERLRQNRPGPGECIRWAAAIADALSEAHSGGVLHRDLKPENIVLAKDGRLRVLDFGLARPMASPELPDYDAAQTVAGAQKPAGGGGREVRPSIDHDREQAVSPPAIDTAGTSGTPAYMAPEQWRGGDLSGAADIWAAGVILHEMLTGHRPFESPTPLEEIRLTRGPDPVIEPDVAATVPDTVVAVMMRCLDKQAANRPASSELKAVLEGAMEVGRAITDSDENPFRGLLPFSESHRHMFFGRDGEIGAFVERLREVPVLAIVGPSGAGKSSFVRAGVIPRMREGVSLTTVELRPGSHPFRELARRLAAAEQGRSGHSSSVTESGDSAAIDTLADELEASPNRLALLAQGLAETRGSRVLIFVDQMEELYTLTVDPEVRRRFLQALVAAADDPDSPVRVVLTVREEFLSRLAEGPELREALAHITILRSPGADQLREILTRSVSRVGYDFDHPDLADRMVDEVADEVSSLPLLQFAGHKLWEGRDRDHRRLLEEVYESMGGVAGALATHADGVLAGLSDRQTGLARTMLLRLVTPEGTRRIATRSQVLAELPESAAEVLDRLVGARLVTVRRAADSDAAELELVHESLLVAWKRLARWLDGSHEEREFLDELENAAELWQRRGRRAAELWQGEALREAEATVKRLELDLPATPRRFIESGRSVEDQRSRRRRLMVAGIITALVAIATVLGVQRHEARSQRDRAEQQRRAAERGQAEALREGATSAWLQGDIFEARCKLRRSLEILDTTIGRALWWRLEGDPLRWRDPSDTMHYQVAYSQDGHTLATSGPGGVISLFDTRTREVQPLGGHEEPTLGVAFSPDGRLVAAGGYGGDVLVWTVADGSLRRLSGHTGIPWNLVFSPDGSELVSASYDTTIWIWDVATGQPRATLEGHEEPIRRIRLSPDGRTLASGGFDGTIRLWDLASAEHLETLDADGPVLALAWSDDGSRIVSGGSNGPTIQLWDVSGTGPPATLDIGHTGGIESLDFSPDGRFVASGSRDWTVRVWDLSGRPHRVFDGAEGEIHMARFSPDGECLAVTSADNGLRVWNVEPPARPAPVSGHTGPVYRAAFSPDGAVVATSSEDETVRLWDVPTGEVIRAITGHESNLYDLAISPDGRMLATTGADRTARLWDMASGELLRVLRDHQREVVAVEFTPAGGLATASVDGVINMWDPDSWTVVGRGEHEAAVLDLAIDATGRTLASVGYDQKVKLWSTTGMRQIRELTGHEGNVYGVRFETDGRHLLSTSHDGSLRRWDTTTGESTVVARFPAIPYFLDIGNDPRLVAIPLIKGDVVLLDRVDGDQLTAVHHDGGSTCAAFSPDGTLLATTGGDGTLLMTQIDNRRPLWRAPALLTSPPLLLNHLGWQELEPGAVDGLPDDAAWRSAVESRARLASQSDDGRVLCLTTWDGAFELWDTVDDAMVFTDAPPTVARLVAVDGGCLSRTVDGGVRLVRVDASFVDLATEATAVGLGDGEIFVADESLIAIFDHEGNPVTTLDADGATSAIARVHGHLVTGTSRGAVVVNGGPDAEFGAVILRATPASPVRRFEAGPPGTVAVGFTNGEVGLWDLASGARLLGARLHGAIVHLEAGPSSLVAASELGQMLDWDLTSLVLPRDDFLVEVRRVAPAIWDNGRPVIPGNDGAPGTRD